MAKQNRLKELQGEKRIPAPKLRREPLPMSISVKHHLPVSAEGTATDLTVAELEAINNKPKPTLEPQQPIKPQHSIKPQLDYSTSQAKQSTTVNTTSNSINKKPKPTLESNTYPSFKRQTLENSKLSNRIDQLVDLDFPYDQNDHDHGYDQNNDHDHTNDYDHDHLDDHDHDDHDHEDDHDRQDYPLFNTKYSKLTSKEPSKNIRANKYSSATSPKTETSKERSIDKIDLNIQSRFVRVPNWVADQLARQISPAEEKVFDQIWRLTVGFNREIWRGKIADLMIRTGYSSRATVTKAIAGLSALGLIRVEGRDTNPRGRSFRIVDKVKLNQEQPKAEQRTASSRKRPEPRFDQEEDFDHAKIVEQTTSQARNSNLTRKSMTTHANSSQVVEPRSYRGQTETAENKKLPPLGQSSSQAFKNNSRKKDDESGYSPSSSSKRDSDDDENFFQVRLIYQDLTGNHWLAKDDLSYREIARVPIPYIILGICYSITRAADHQISSLKYCIPSIREHFELMRAFPHKDLLEIAYRHLVLVKEAQRNGRWAREID